MKKMAFTVLIMTAALTLSFGVTGWADNSPTAYEDTGSPLSPTVKATGDVQPEQASTSKFDVNYKVSPAKEREAAPSVPSLGGADSKVITQVESSKTDFTYSLERAPSAGITKEIVPFTPSVTIDVSQGTGALQAALDKGIKDITITGQGMLNSDSLRIPEGTTISIGQDVSLVLGDPTLGDLPAEVTAGSVGAGTSITMTSTLTELTGSEPILLTVDSLKADIRQLRLNLKSATTAQARKGILSSIKRDQQLIQDIRNKHRKAFRKIPAQIHRPAKKK